MTLDIRDILTDLYKFKEKLEILSSIRDHRKKQ